MFGYFKFRKSLKASAATVLIFLLTSVPTFAEETSASTQAVENARRAFYKAANGDPEALAAFRAQAMTGDSDAEFMLGNVLTYYGHHCEEGVMWLKNAAAQGHEKAQTVLFALYGSGGHCDDQTFVDPVEAYYWRLISLKTSRQYPNLPGSLGSSDMKWPSQKVEDEILLGDFEKQLSKDQITLTKARVAEWKPISSDVKVLAMKAVKGNAEAQYQLGLIYLEGKIVPRNVWKALSCLKRSADQGYENAQAALAKASSELSPSERSGMGGEKVLGVPSQPHGPGPHACEYPS